MKKPELLAPAGNLEKLHIALRYGADAVYFGGESFSLRAGAGNLNKEDMARGLESLHLAGKKGYLALNIYPHEEDIAPLEAYLDEISSLPIDGFIVSDPGVMELLAAHVDKPEIHLSTQASLTNHQAANFWYKLGVKRIVVAREMSLGEIKILRQNIPEDMEVEAFCHGAMCISYSGRCLLSNFMVGRDANKGECAHACRWQYDLRERQDGEAPCREYALEEKQRPGEYYPIEEDTRGTYIMNSKDLCMIEHLEDMLSAGVHSFKIEGRIKTAFYLATAVKQYRQALDAAVAAQDKSKGRATNGSDHSMKEQWLGELQKVSNRGFTTGFFYSKPSEEAQDYQTWEYKNEYTFTGLVQSYDRESGIAVVQQRNKMVVGEEIEIFGPTSGPFCQTLTELWDEEGNPLQSAPHPKQMLKIKMKHPVEKDSIIRIRENPRHKKVDSCQ